MVFQGSQGRWGHTSSATYCYTFKELRAQLNLSCKEEGYSSLDQAFIMQKMVISYKASISCASLLSPRSDLKQGVRYLMERDKRVVLKP